LVPLIITRHLSGCLQKKRRESSPKERKNHKQVERKTWASHFTLKSVEEQKKTQKSVDDEDKKERQ